MGCGTRGRQSFSVDRTAAIRIESAVDAIRSDRGLGLNRSDAHHADFCRHQVAESVEPLHVGLQVARLLVVAVAALEQTAKRIRLNE